MLKAGMFALVLSVLCLASIGCGPTETKKGNEAAPAPTSGEEKKTSATESVEGQTMAVAYCGKCGETKGSDKCCAADAKVCEKCSLHAGTALCCKQLGDLAGKDVCAKCGLAAGTAECCAKDAATCDKCHLAKSSALCCQLHSADGHAHEGEEAAAH